MRKYISSFSERILTREERNYPLDSKMLNDTASYTSTTTTTTITTSPQLRNDNTNMQWYDYIGPVIAVLFVLVLFAACFKCVSEICGDCAIIKSCCRREDDSSTRDDEGRRSLSINIDLPPRYSTTVITNVDLENNIILETDTERIRRERRERRRKGIEEDKLPTYLEIIEEDRTKNHQNPAFESEDIEENDKSVNHHENEADLDTISVITESNLPPPPPYQAPC